MSTEQPTVRLWRCAGCDKWSHAKRKPRKHVRIVVDQPADECPGWDWQHCCAPHPCGAATPQISHEEECGPFEEWRAEKVA